MWVGEKKYAQNSLKETLAAEKYAMKMQNTRSSLRGSFPRERERVKRDRGKQSSIGICSFAVLFLEDTKKWRCLRWVGRSPNNCAIIEVGT